MSLYWKRFYAVLRKDLLVEARTGSRLTVMSAFAILVGLLFNFAIDTAVVRPEQVVSGLVWMTIVFGGLLGLGQTFHLEEENGVLEAVLMTPLPRDALYLAKVTSNFVLIMAIVALVLFVFAIFFGVGYGPRLHWLVLLLALGTLGFVALGTLFSAVTARSTMRETLLPILVFPLLVPVVVFGASATNRLVAGLPASEITSHVRILAAFALVTLFVGSMLFRFVVEDA